MGHLQNNQKNEHPSIPTFPGYDRALLLHGCKRNKVLSLEEVEKYGIDSFADADYVSIYGMRPRMVRPGHTSARPHGSRVHP